MPFSCAKAVCATFCHHISGALIPIFGPRFPDQCIPPDAPDHGRMCIDPSIVTESTQEADRFRKLYAEQSSLALTASPRHLQPRRNDPFHGRGPMAYDHNSSPYNRRQRYNPRNGRGLDSPYGTDTDDNDGYSGPEGGCGDVDVRDFARHRYPYTPVPSLRSVHTATVTSSGWTPHNIHQVQVQPRHRQPSAAMHQNQARYVLNDGPGHRDQQYHDANPWLSAVPRLPGFVPPQPTPSRPLQPQRHNHTLSHAPIIMSSATFPGGPSKRPRTTAEYPDTDHEYDGGESQGSSPTNPHPTPQVGGTRLPGNNNSVSQHSNSHRQLLPLPSVSSTTAERNAAMLLMNLSMTETDADNSETNETGLERNNDGESSRFRSTPEIGSMRRGYWDDEHRSKRKRATSM
jgi:hypothetical protein